MGIDRTYISNVSCGSALSLSPSLWLMPTPEWLQDLLEVKLNVKSDSDTISTFRDRQYMVQTQISKERVVDEIQQELHFEFILWFCIQSVATFEDLDNCRVFVKTS